MGAFGLSNLMLVIILTFLVGSLSFLGIQIPSFAQTTEDDEQANNNTTTTIQEEAEDVAENATEAAQSVLNELTQRLRRIQIPDVNVSDINIPNINFPNVDLGATDPSLLSNLSNLYNLDPDIDQAPFPPPLVGGQTDTPDYTIDIPHNAGGQNPTFEPAEVGVPVGTTIMWINKDSAPHTVTTFRQGVEFSPPESFDSSHIPGTRSGLFEVTPFGGSFIHTFDKPGVYEYFCTIHPNHEGKIVVGDTIQFGRNGTMVLMEGANLPFNASELSRVLLAVVPSKEVIDLPPTTTMAYNVSILGPVPQGGGAAANQTGIGPINNPNRMLYSEQFLDTDGVLYLELIPQPAVNGSTSDFVTWGPDISATATGPHTGAFHIKGPVMVQNEPYTMQVSIVNIDEEILEQPITEEFILSPKLARPSS
ncbi:MAG: plastocyanin/azurin family copper-binding protein [Thermoproteota archaeon]|nr:plastocyanin/azurin family copper-binding protein [Thermoproteota archaeon]